MKTNNPACAITKEKGVPSMAGRKTREESLKAKMETNLAAHAKLGIG
jgi:hypothetical protein